VNIEAVIKTFKPQIKDFSSNVVSGVLGLGSTVLLTLISIIIAGALMVKADAAEISARKAFKILIGRKGEGFTELAGATYKKRCSGSIGCSNNTSSSFRNSNANIQYTFSWSMGIDCTVSCNNSVAAIINITSNCRLHL